MCLHPKDEDCRPVAEKVFMLKLSEMQPSQLYICSEKLHKVVKKFNATSPKMIEPIPVKKLGGDIIIVDMRGLLQPFYVASQKFQFIGNAKSWTGMPTKFV